MKINKTYTVIPNNIGEFLIPVDVYRFTCLSFTPRPKGYTDSTFKQIRDITGDKSDRTIQDFVQRLRESKLIDIETYTDDKLRKRNKYYVPHYQTNFKRIHKGIIDLKLSNTLKGFLIMMSGQCLNNTRECYYSQAKLGEIFNLNRNTVGKYLKELIAEGLIVKIKKGYEITAPIILINTERQKEMVEVEEMVKNFPKEHFVHTINFDRALNPKKYLEKCITKNAVIDNDYNDLTIIL